MYKVIKKKEKKEKLIEKQLDIIINGVLVGEQRRDEKKGTERKGKERKGEERRGKEEGGQRRAVLCGVRLASAGDSLEASMGKFCCVMGFGLSTKKEVGKEEKKKKKKKKMMESARD
ncbi:hypothetical protein M0804_012254 [Polistes exclamans]|nr:hypothetical protein M0804_012254 [Polistes exclamans]